MKYLYLFYAIVCLCCAAVAAAADEVAEAVEAVEAAETAKAAEAIETAKAAEIKPVFGWGLLWSGSWEESKTLHNRAEIKLNFLPPELLLRGQVLDRHTMNFELDPPWGDPQKGVTNFLGGLYHKPTGSRLMYGVLDEWGLSARIRNPWIRSAPFAENHKPLMADLKTAASVTKEDEAYLYLSTPFLPILWDIKLKGFASAQTGIERFTPAFSGGLDAILKKDTELLLEGFYTRTKLPPTKSNSWFSYPPPLPERDFNLYALGLLYSSPLVSVSGDFAYSETFAWGADKYGNIGIRLTPPVSSKSKKRPLAISLAADGGGERIVYRDGAGHGAGFRTAGKIEWKGRQNSLLRVNTTLRGPGLGEEFNRSSSGFYLRFPAPRRNAEIYPVRLTRISLSADRNSAGSSANQYKMNDGYSGNIGFSINMPKETKISPIGVNLAASLKSQNLSETAPSPYPVSWDEWHFDNAGGSCELTWSPLNLLFKAKLGYTAYAKKDENWDISLSAAARFKQGRLSIKTASADFPEKWLWTVSWRLEPTGKK